MLFDGIFFDVATAGLLAGFRGVIFDKKEKAKRARRLEEEGKGEGAGGGGKNNQGRDDGNYDYVYSRNENIGHPTLRYTIIEKIGKGSFGQVVKAWDREDKKEVAIKIIKSKRPFTVQAKTEIQLLKFLSDKDPDDESNIVRLVNHFFYRNHQCLVFEMLSLNLYELLKNTNFRGVSLNLIRKFCKQILHSLRYLSREDVRIIHCDLKPENILLRSPRRSAVKVIDFGSSCRESKRMYSYIQSRFYRSPEVMLGVPYGCEIDMWSLGCILVEMHTGEPLFAGSEQKDQMMKLCGVLGMPPDAMIDGAPEQGRRNFFEKVNGAWRLKAGGDKNAEVFRGGGSGSRGYARENLERILGARTGGPRGHRANDDGHQPRDYEIFIDLILGMLEYDPKGRVKPTEALEHAFFGEGDRK